MDKPMRIIAPHSFREQLSRRAFLKIGTATAGLAVVAAACGNSGSKTSDTSGGGSTAGAPTRPSAIAAASGRQISSSRKA